MGLAPYTSVARSRSESSSFTALALKKPFLLLLLLTASALNKPSISSSTLRSTPLRMYVILKAEALRGCHDEKWRLQDDIISV